MGHVPSLSQGKQPFVVIPKNNLVPRAKKYVLDLLWETRVPWSGYIQSADLEKLQSRSLENEKIK